MFISIPVQQTTTGTGKTEAFEQNQWYFMVLNRQSLVIDPFVIEMHLFQRTLATYQN